VSISSTMWKFRRGEIQISVASHVYTLLAVFIVFLYLLYSRYYAGQKILAVIVCQFKKKKNCNPYFIVIMITVLIMNVILWVVNFKTQNYFVISTTQNVYLRLSMYDCSNFVHSCRIFGISELQTV
jgi:hypothetical protein